MTQRRWLCTLTAIFAALLLSTAAAAAQGRGHRNDDDEDRGRGKGHEKYAHRYSHRDRKEMRVWYRNHGDNLPPGLAKRDQLPPGLERQLRVRGTLPPGLRDRLQPVPLDFERALPPPPPDCEHAIIGGHLILLNRRTFLILDILHFER